MDQPSIEITRNDLSAILSNLSQDNFLGKGAAGIVYKFNYYNIVSAVKIPINSYKKDSIRSEIYNYSYLCKAFNNCNCKNNIIQMLGYDLDDAIIILEYFDGSDLTKYVRYPMHSSTFHTHRLLPRSEKDKSADFTSLGQIFRTSSRDSTIWTMFNKIYTGLLCIHTVGLIHRDFELKNILINSKGRIGISDFGLSLVLNEDILSYGSEFVCNEFKKDISLLGPMMGDFLDSTNIEPYQFRMDYGNINNVPILNSIQDSNLQDTFLLLTSFSDIVVFVSFIYYINKNNTNNNDFITDASSTANTYINDELSSNQMYIYQDQVDNIKSNIQSTLISGSGLVDLLKYFRLVINKMLYLGGVNSTLGDKSIHTFLSNVFGSNYDIIIKDLSIQIRYGFLLTHFDLFTKIYHKI